MQRVAWLAITLLVLTNAWYILRPESVQSATSWTFFLARTDTELYTILDSIPASCAVDVEVVSGFEASFLIFASCPGDAFIRNPELPVEGQL